MSNILLMASVSTTPTIMAAVATAAPRQASVQARAHSDESNVKYCKDEAELGSHIVVRTCKTIEEWRHDDYLARVRSQHAITFVYPQ